MRNSNERKYLTVLFTTATLLLCAVVTFNWVVDPYCIFHDASTRELHYKPAVYKRVRLLKAYEVRRLKPESIVLGSSRAHIGIRPTHPLWSRLSKRRYNLAFDAATPKEMYSYLVHAQSMHPLKQVILGLDTWDLNSGPVYVQRDFDESILAKGTEPLDTARLTLADLKILSSFDTLRSSVNWLADSHQRSVWFAPDGQRLGEIFFAAAGEDYQSRGPRYYFEKVDKAEVKNYLMSLPKQSTRNYPSDQNADNSVTSLGYIDRIIKYCREKEIDLKIFISPSHARQLLIADATGNWSRIEDGKREIVELLERDASLHPQRKPIPLFDFNNFSTVTTEPLPSFDSKSGMRFYWDSSHYKENVGDLVLDCILNPDEGKECALGERMNKDNIDRILKEIRQRKLEYESKFADDVRVIRGYVSDLQRKNGLGHAP